MLRKQVNLVVREPPFTFNRVQERLLREEKVAVVPGNAFGDSGEGFIRISYAYSIENLKLALERIERFVKKLQESNHGLV